MHFQRGASLKQPEKERLTKIVDSFFHVTDRHTRVSFCDYMNFYGINAMFRENKEGRVYGLTLIDNKNGVVFNGSDLGKAYSGQALAKQFHNWVAGEKERQTRVDPGIHWPQIERYDHSQPNWKLDVPKEILDLTKAEMVYPGPTNKYFKRRKKTKRGPSR